MRVFPVIERELRAAARHSSTYTLRVLGVFALLSVLVLSALEGTLGGDAGERLFAVLHAALFLAIWVLVPQLTADCISRERREGTLPLLFLAPLTAPAIVWAKGVAHGWRAFTLWLAALPVLTIPFISGGVGWADVALSVLVNFSSLCLATAAGLLASAWSKSGNQARMAAVCLAFLFFAGFMLAVPCFLTVVPGAGVGGFPSLWRNLSPADMLAVAMNQGGAWNDLLGFASGGPGMIVCAFAAAGFCSLFTLLLLVRLAAWKVNRTWRDPPPSARVLRLKKKLLQPILLQSLLRRWLRWELQHNPIGWLERRSPLGRVVIWSWFAVVVCLYSCLLSTFGRYMADFHPIQVLLAWMLAGSIALSAAGSFRRERETGVLELLLISPLREGQIIGGRLRGLWSQFLPSAILLCGLWIYLATFLAEQMLYEFPAVMNFIVLFATVPVVALYFSLAKSSFIAAVIWTLLCQVAAPFALTWSLEYFGGPFSPSSQGYEPNWLLPFARAAFQTLLAAVFFYLLHNNLKRRKFALAA